VIGCEIPDIDLLAFLKSGILPRVAEIIEKGTEFLLADSTCLICQRASCFPKKEKKRRKVVS
jgi:hypothetical protein